VSQERYGEPAVGKPSAQRVREQASPRDQAGPNAGVHRLDRRRLHRQAGEEVNRLQKTLEGANLKLASVATDVLGVSGRDMLAALLGGEQDPAVLAELARGKLRAKLPALRRALAGRVRPHHLVLVGQILAHIDFLEESIAHVQEEIGRRQAPFAAAVQLLQTIPGVGAVAATAIVAEVGTDIAVSRDCPPTSGGVAVAVAGVAPSLLGRRG
jgi:transposase